MFAAAGLTACATAPAPVQYPGAERPRVKPQPKPQAPRPQAPATAIGERFISAPPPWPCKGDEAGATRQRLVDHALAEWAAFGAQTIDYVSGEARPRGPEALFDGARPVSLPIRAAMRENDPRSDQHIAKYWSAVDVGEVHRQNRRWEADPSRGWTTPWSGAFIAWALCASGAPASLNAQSGLHFARIQQALNFGLAPPPTLQPFFTYFEAADMTPAPGDLICFDRQDGRGDLSVPLNQTHFAPGQPSRPLHCDIVVKTEENRVFAIGGNVTDAVRMTIAPLVNGRLTYEARSSRRWFAVLKLNNAGEGDADRSRFAGRAPPVS